MKNYCFYILFFYLAQACNENKIEDTNKLSLGKNGNHEIELYEKTNQILTFLAKQLYSIKHVNRLSLDELAQFYIKKFDLEQFKSLKNLEDKIQEGLFIDLDEYEKVINESKNELASLWDNYIMNHKVLFSFLYYSGISTLREIIKGDPIYSSSDMIKSVKLGFCDLTKRKLAKGFQCNPIWAIYDGIVEAFSNIEKHFGDPKKYIKAREILEKYENLNDANYLKFFSDKLIPFYTQLLDKAHEAILEEIRIKICHNPELIEYLNQYRSLQEKGDEKTIRKLQYERFLEFEAK